jgi:hypothetical protein
MRLKINYEPQLVSLVKIAHNRITAASRLLSTEHAWRRGSSFGPDAKHATTKTPNDVEALRVVVNGGENGEPQQRWKCAAIGAAQPAGAETPAFRLRLQPLCSAGVRFAVPECRRLKSVPPQPFFAELKKRGFRFRNGTSSHNDRRIRQTT